MSDVKYPEIEVDLSDHDGNAMVIMGRVTRAMKRAGVEMSEIEAYRKKAMSGDYDHLLQVTMETVTVL